MKYGGRHFRKAYCFHICQNCNFIREMISLYVGNVIQLDYLIPGRFDSHHRPCFFRGGGMHMVSDLFADIIVS